MLFTVLRSPAAMFTTMPSFYFTLDIGSCALVRWAIHWSGWFPSDHSQVILTPRTSVNFALVGMQLQPWAQWLPPATIAEDTVISFCFPSLIPPSIKVSSIRLAINHASPDSCPEFLSVCGVGAPVCGGPHTLSTCMEGREQPKCWPPCFYWERVIHCPGAHCLG